VGEVIGEWVCIFLATTGPQHFVAASVLLSGVHTAYDIVRDVVRCRPTSCVKASNAVVRPDFVRSVNTA